MQQLQQVQHSRQSLMHLLVPRLRCHVCWTESADKVQLILIALKAVKMPNHGNQLWHMWLLLLLLLLQLTIP